ncbi:ATP-binding cassette domain-containing protein [Clostridium sp. 'deep sea']|uniref:ribosomal protection-like ABC-F family protein n=1 Tax=Clostridium sp. 'deep sea' TaxID=2779445 RepID=UPI00189667FE|nr:ABC-F family ATP-binding cassette domain-containing protein [Clostridium sp. 'deep sea']QOR33971.1 ATP-binding cassette domain-containing protein [Clostridium sp. 'deep sea']
MALCAVSNLAKYYGADLVFQNITFEIDKGQRIGLIGPNGVGKTTLLKILMEQEDYQEGTIFKRSNIRLDYLDQIPVYPDSLKTIDVLFEAFSSILKIEKQLENMQQKMSLCKGEELNKIVKLYGELEHSYEQMGGYDMHERLNRIVIGLNINENMQQRAFEMLSGGEKSRVILGKILLEEPDILLLDEPSNHLDLSFMAWLEAYLQDYKGAVVIVSHDRWFLDRAVNKIVEIEQDCAEIYNGNYSYYQVESQRRLEEKFNMWQAKQRQVDKLEEQIEQFLIWGRARDSEKMFKRAKELKKRLAKIVVPDKPRMENKKIRILKNNVTRTAKEVLRVKSLGHQFENKRLFSNFDLTVFYQEKIGILGSNGTGKSTLLKIIMGLIEPSYGKVEIGSRVKIGYLPQEVEFDNPNSNLIEVFQSQYQITATEVRHELARVLFTGDDVFKSVNTLSGGERSRLKLCLLMYGGANVLILDEPTNHLDIDSREELENSLQKYEGTVIFVSHDRYFIDTMAGKILEIKNSKIDIYKGNYQYYLKQLEKKQAKTVGKSEHNKLSQSKQDYQSHKALQSEMRKQDKQLKSYTQQIKEAENRLLEIENLMKSSVSNVQKLQELYKNQNETEELLMDLIEKHEDLEKIIKNR